jgi:hypothetical protein
MREDGLIAYVKSPENQVYAIGLIGSVRIAVVAHELVITRRDDTVWRWHQRDSRRDARDMAVALKAVVPELAESDVNSRWVWVIATVAKPGEPLPGTEVVNTLPLPGYVARTIVDHMRTDERQIILGAFPIPADTPSHGEQFTKAIHDAIKHAAWHVWDAQLTITARAL